VTDPFIILEDMDLVQAPFGAVQPRLVPFLLSLFVPKATFALLTRYYIVNAVTGAHHLFVFKAKKKEEQRTKWFPLSKE